MPRTNKVDVVVHDTVTQLQAANAEELRNGAGVSLRGYRAAGDFGQPLQGVIAGAGGGTVSIALSDGRFVNFDCAGPINALWFGAYRDGTNPGATTAAIRAALAAASGDSGRTVYLPEGVYVTNGTITIPINVTLMGGERHFPAGWKLFTLEARPSTIIRPDTKGGDAFWLERGAGLQGLVIHKWGTDYPQVTAAIAAWNGTAVRMEKGVTPNFGHGAFVRECDILGFEWAIRLIDATDKWLGQFYIGHVFIDCLRGIKVEGSGQWSVIENIMAYDRLAPGDSGIGENIYRPGPLLSLKRLDGQLCHNFSIFGYKRAIEILDEVQCTNIGNVQIDGAGEIGVPAVDILGDTITGLNISGMNMMGFWPLALRVATDVNSAVMVCDSRFGGLANGTNIKVDKCQCLQLNHCSFDPCDTAIQVVPDGGVDLMVNGCRFAGAGEVLAYDVVDSTNTAVWTGNRLTLCVSPVVNEPVGAWISAGDSLI